MTIRHIVQNLCLITVFVLMISVLAPRVSAQSPTPQIFTAASLAQYDGQNGHSAYFAYKGQVYDATGQPNWVNGLHFTHLAGKDLTSAMSLAPHGDEVLKGLPIVGTFQVEAQGNSAPAAQVSTARPWYLGPIRILGLSILAWTGILLGIAFVLNFATCFALPWSGNPLPWNGSRPGPDPLDAAPVHQKWTSVHKYFAWATVVLGIIHGIIGFLQLFGYTI